MTVAFRMLGRTAVGTRALGMAGFAATIEDVRAALESLAGGGAAPMIDSGLVRGNPEALGVVGAFGQPYYDRPSDQLYRCNAAGGGNTWTATRN